MNYRIEIFSRLTLFMGRQYYFRIRHANGKVIAVSEGYRNRGDCRQIAQNLRDGLGQATIHGA